MLSPQPRLSLPISPLSSLALFAPNLMSEATLPPFPRSPAVIPKAKPWKKSAPNLREAAEGWLAVAHDDGLAAKQPKEPREDYFR